mmetsp:Transcript_14963/g.48841  ORF Transcript_14963/g.48841 Transcript_14963/m.48841 type:complete len:309 (+) Transcript_14963:458-1384(+)
MWGVIAWFGMVRQGWSLGAGWGNQTSPMSGDRVLSSEGSKQATKHNRGEGPLLCTHREQGTGNREEKNFGKSTRHNKASRDWDAGSRITAVAGELSGFEGAGDGVAVAELAACGVDEVGAPFHVCDEGVVDHVLRLRVEGAIQRDDVASGGEGLGVGVVGESEFVFHNFWKAVAVRVMEDAVEGFQALEDGQADASRGDGADGHALEVVAPCDAVGDVPAAGPGDVVGGPEVADEVEDGHHHMFGDGDRVAKGHFRHRDARLARGLQVDVVRPDARRNGHLQLRRLGDALRRYIGRPERLADDDLRVF